MILPIFISHSIYLVILSYKIQKSIHHYFIPITKFLHFHFPKYFAFLTILNQFGFDFVPLF